jgi:hypothetical protein
MGYEWDMENIEETNTREKNMLPVLICFMLTMERNKELRIKDGPKLESFKIIHSACLRTTTQWSASTSNYHTNVEV